MKDIEDVLLSICSSKKALRNRDAIFKSLIAYEVVLDNEEPEDDPEELIIKDFIPARVDNFMEYNGGL